MQRTIRIQLEPSPAQVTALAETSRQFTVVFNAVCAYGWQQSEKHGVELHRALYSPLKADYPALVSDLHVPARVKATEALNRALALRRAGRKVNQPHADACPPRSNLHTYRVDWDDRTLRLSLIGGRQPIRCHLPASSAKYAGSPTATADLIARDGEWWLHVVVPVAAPEIAPSDQVVGVDLGIRRPAVTSNNRFLGKQAWNAREGRLFQLKRALQKTGTRSAKRHLKRVRHRQRRFRRDCDHVLSKQIVQSVEPGATIVLENLKDSHKRMQVKRRAKTKRRMHAWSFARLKTKIEYKAEERGGTVVGVDPQQTAQLWSCCGHVARASRRSQSVCMGRTCGDHRNADLNAARNIAAKHHADGSKAAIGGLLVNPPIVSNPLPLASG